VLLDNGHIFIDALVKKFEGKAIALASWEAYFKLYPDFHMDINQVMVQGDTVAAFGFAEGNYRGIKENHWRVPASWKAVVYGHQLKLWQVYADPKLPVDAMNINNPTVPDTLARVTGVGGLFFKCKDPKNVREWYKLHLHMDTNPYGTKFEWRQGSDPSKYGCTQWSVFGEKTTYFAPSAKDFMINYRVHHIVQLVEQLRKDGVTIVDNIDDTDYGKFVHILDCEQNKVELWEPKDADYDKVVGGPQK
jgi:predicted enzyme related to lactoylglutathione lyase